MKALRPRSRYPVDTNGRVLTVTGKLILGKKYSQQSLPPCCFHMKSNSFFVTKTYRLGRFAELTYEELALPSSFKASFTFERKNLSEQRKRLCFTLQARRSRTKISVDSGVAFAVALLMLTLLGQATAYVLPKGGLSSRKLIKQNLLPSMSTAAPILLDAPSKLSYPEVAFGTVGVKTPSIDPDVAAARRGG